MTISMTGQEKGDHMDKIDCTLHLHRYCLTTGKCLKCLNSPAAWCLGYKVLSMSIHTFHIWFSLNNLSSSEANQLKCIHKVRDRIKDGHVIFFLSGFMPMFIWAGSRDIHDLWTHSSIFFLLWFIKQMWRLNIFTRFKIHDFDIMYVIFERTFVDT